MILKTTSINIISPPQPTSLYNERVTCELCVMLMTFATWSEYNG